MVPLVLVCEKRGAEAESWQKNLSPHFGLASWTGVVRLIATDDNMNQGASGVSTGSINLHCGDSRPLHIDPPFKCNIFPRELPKYAGINQHIRKTHDDDSNDCENIQALPGHNVRLI